ncbi:MAG TPA: hypothetical protein VK604_01330, partial [Bryobacteraceae bacterium]|nr:hypothetical protein [Bryobacteraceae bacterium]
TETSGNLYGIYVDSADGLASPSFRVRNSFVANNGLVGPTVYGTAMIGTQINDMMFYGFETAGVDYGVFVNQTGFQDAITSADIHFTGSIHDGCRISCYLIQGLTAAAGAGVEINGGYLTNSATHPLIDIESSYGVHVSGVQFGVAAGGVNTCVVANNSSHISLVNNLCNGVVNAGFLLIGTTSSTITGNVLDGVSAVNGLILLQNNSDLNSITANVLSGQGNSILVDATSNANTGLDTNTISAPLAGAVVTGSNPLTPKVIQLGTTLNSASVVTYSCTFVAGACSIAQTAFTTTPSCTIAQVNSGVGAGTAEPQIWISGLTSTTLNLAASSTSYAGAATAICVGH